VISYTPKERKPDEGNLTNEISWNYNTAHDIRNQACTMVIYFLECGT